MLITLGTAKKERKHPYEPACLLGLKCQVSELLWGFQLDTMRQEPLDWYCDAAQVQHEKITASI